MSRGELLYWQVVERRDGSKAVFSIYKDGGALRIVTNQGGEHLVSRGRDLERELRVVYGAKVLQTHMPSQGYPSLD